MSAQLRGWQISCQRWGTLGALLWRGTSCVRSSLSWSCCKWKRYIFVHICFKHGSVLPLFLPKGTLNYWVIALFSGKKFFILFNKKLGPDNFFLLAAFIFLQDECPVDIFHTSYVCIKPSVSALNKGLPYCSKDGENTCPAGRCFLLNFFNMQYDQIRKIYQYLPRLLVSWGKSLHLRLLAEKPVTYRMVSPWKILSSFIAQGLSVL